MGLTQALSLRLGAIKQRRRGHDPGRVIRDLAVMVADGGECVSDLGAVREQGALFGPVASDSTAFRMVDRIACTPGLLDAVRVAHARARACQSPSLGEEPAPSRSLPGPRIRKLPRAARSMTGADSVVQVVERLGHVLGHADGAGIGCGMNQGQRKGAA